MRSDTGRERTGNDRGTDAANERRTTDDHRRARRWDPPATGELRGSSVRDGGVMEKTNSREPASGREIHRAHHDVDGSEPITVTIIKAIAHATDEDPLELPPLREAVRLDLDALDDLFVHGPTGRPSPDTCLRFEYVGHVVFVYGDGRVSVRRSPGHDRHPSSNTGPGS